jgi:hypothetical protein
MYRDTLLYALALAGSERELARQLRVTVSQVENWLSGADEIPERIFQRTIDLVTASSRQAIHRSREFLSRKSASH